MVEHESWDWVVEPDLLLPGARGDDDGRDARPGEGIEVIRREHRYALVWPSIHPDTRREYCWYTPDGEIGDRLPKIRDFAMLPEEWIDGLGAQRKAEATPEPTTANEGFDAPARTFTEEQAREFCRPAIEALKKAQNGEINNRLNDAAVTLSHFVPEFWSVEQATKWLMKALESTVYDGRTWKAETTIRSGLSAPTWKAERVEPEAFDSVEDSPSESNSEDREVREEVRKLRIRDRGRQIYNAEKHAALWTPPEDFGNLANELTLPDDEPPWRVRNLLGVGHNAILVAGRKVGKTTTVNSLIRSLVDDELFLGRFEVEPFRGDVAVFNYEVTAKQYREWLRDAGIRNADRVHALHLRGQSLPLASEHVQAWLVDWLRERDVKVWIVDPYSRAYIGSVDNGNDEAKVSVFLDTLDQIKARAGVSELVMPVHTPKARVEAGEETAIGSQRLEAWADGLWYQMRDRDPEVDARYFRAEVRGAEVSEEQLQYDPATRRVTIGGWNRSRAAFERKNEAVVRYVTENPGQGVNEIHQGMSKAKDFVSKALKAAVERGDLDVFDGPNRSKIYYLPGGSHIDECRCHECGTRKASDQG